MKARFDRGITNADTVCLALFKRVFPRFGACYHPQLLEARAEDEEDDSL